VKTTSFPQAACPIKWGFSTEVGACKSFSEVLGSSRAHLCFASRCVATALLDVHLRSPQQAGRTVGLISRLTIELSTAPSIYGIAGFQNLAAPFSDQTPD